MTASARSLSKAGSKNPNAKLTASKVAAIRHRVAQHPGERGYKAELAKAYGISAGTLSDIITGRRWPQEKDGKK